MPSAGQNIRVRFGGQLRFHGLLIAPGGAPIAHGQVTVDEVIPGWFSGQVAVLSTNARGAFVYHAPAGPSRSLTFTFAGAPGAGGATREIAVAVRSRAVVHMPSAVRVGQRVRIWGQVLGGYVPAGGVKVQLQYRVIGVADGWKQFGHPIRCNGSGRWAASPGRWLAASGGYTYQVRAVIRSGPAWPFAGSVSAPVTRYVAG